MFLLGITSSSQEWSNVLGRHYANQYSRVQVDEVGDLSASQQWISLSSSLSWVNWIYFEIPWKKSHATLWYCVWGLKLHWASKLRTQTQNHPDGSYKSLLRLRLFKMSPFEGHDEPEQTSVRNRRFHVRNLERSSHSARVRFEASFWSGPVSQFEDVKCSIDPVCHDIWSTHLVQGFVQNHDFIDFAVDVSKPESAASCPCCCLAVDFSRLSTRDVSLLHFQNSIPGVLFGIFRPFVCPRCLLHGRHSCFIRKFLFRMTRQGHQ